MKALIKFRNRSSQSQRCSLLVSKTQRKAVNSLAGLPHHFQKNHHFHNHHNPSSCPMKPLISQSPRASSTPLSKINPPLNTRRNITQVFNTTAGARSFSLPDLATRVKYGYGYKPSDLRRLPQEKSQILGGKRQEPIGFDNELVEVDHSKTMYVLGGLYGNQFALEEVLRMRRLDQESQGEIPLFFMGNFNGLNFSAPSFQEINRTVLKNNGIRGYLEEEIGKGFFESGEVNLNECHKDFISPEALNAENEMVRSIRQISKRFMMLFQRITALPRYSALIVRNSENKRTLKLGLYHGDPFNLTGTLLNPENLAPVDEKLRDQLSMDSKTSFTKEDFQQILNSSGTNGFILGNGSPYFQDVIDENISISVGRCGLPNFKELNCGIFTRISQDLTQPSQSLYGLVLENSGIRFDAMPVHFDVKAFEASIVQDWTEKSKVALHFLNQLRHPPDYSIAQAVRGRLTQNYSLDK